MNTLEQRKAQLLDEFRGISEWDDKYKIIIQKGKSLSLDDKLKTDENKVKGCQSQVWVTCQLDGDKLIYNADSDAMIAKGLVALLTELYSGLTPQEVIADDMEIIKMMGLDSHLSPSRTNGLYSMIKKMKYYAVAYQAMLSQQPNQ
ncbi:SufE family protein [bacterium]|nr:SufE family protein [bacterium]